MAKIKNSGAKITHAKGRASPLLKGWIAIAKFQGQTPAVAQRWHESGMPVQHNGKRVSAVPEELTRWVGTESGKAKPIHISDEQENLLADLKEGLAFVRKTK